MSLQFSEEEIKILFADFQAIKKYADKVHFFDLHFRVAPFEFPKYETDIFKFFSAVNVSRLTEILRIEQKDLSFLEKVFKFQHSSFIFSIKPSNSQGNTLNDYLVSKFLSKSDQLGLLSITRRKLNGKTAPSQEALFEEANQMIAYLRKRIDAEYEKKPSVEIQLMTVFMKGYSDGIHEIRRPVFKKRRKFLELYLYVYGFLYAKYMEMLSSCEQRVQRPGLYDKIELLTELGLMDAIKKKYFSLNREELNVKTAEIIAFITGEQSKKSADRSI